MSFTKILKVQAARYPDMKFSDYVKLVWQSEFGGSHLAEETASDALRDEFAHAREEHYAPTHTVEAIGNGLCRFHLDPRRLQEDELDLLERCFRASAQSRGSKECFWNKLGVITGLSEAGELPLSSDEWEDFLIEYEQKNCPLPRHSDTYRLAYRPHYRVMERDWAIYFPALQTIDAALREGEPVIVAVDGRCAAGKTTFAARLRKLYGERCAVFHMDEYFLPPEKRTVERLAIPGGNIDYERCAEELFAPLRRGESLNLRAFDCATGVLGEPVRAARKQLNVVEGSYALHPALAEYSHIHVFLTCSPEIQFGRLVRRESPERVETFLNRWIPLEENYFDGCHISEKCDVIVDTSRLPILC